MGWIAREDDVQGNDPGNRAANGLHAVDDLGLQALRCVELNRPKCFEQQAEAAAEATVTEEAADSALRGRWRFA